MIFLFVLCLIYPLIFLFPCIHRYATITSVQRNTNSTDATNKQIKEICRKATNIRLIRQIRVREKKHTHDLRGFNSNTDLSDSTDASLGGRYCLPDSSPFIIGNPETPSRVTLASLGIVFQTTKLNNIHTMWKTEWRNIWKRCGEMVEKGRITWG